LGYNPNYPESKNCLKKKEKDMPLTEFADEVGEDESFNRFIQLCQEQAELEQLLSKKQLLGDKKKEQIFARLRELKNSLIPSIVLQLQQRIYG
jgi:uncharacterized membrane protein YfhO